MKKKMFNRGISILLVVVMLLSMSGVTAFGETEDGTFSLEDIKVFHEQAMRAFPALLDEAENTIDLRGMFALPGSDSIGRVNYSEIDANNYNQLNLTEDERGQISSAWYEYRVDLYQELGFTIKSKVWLGDKPQYDEGGSGITFTLQNAGGRKTALGSISGGLGVGTVGQGNDHIKNGIAIEIDTFLNRFIKNNSQANRYGQDEDIIDKFPIVTEDNHLFHLAIQRTPLASVENIDDELFVGEHINPAIASTDDADEEDVFGQWLDFEVSWTKQASLYMLMGVLTIGEKEYLTYEVFSKEELENIFGDARYVYWGFTAATGGDRVSVDKIESNEQRVSFDSLPMAAQALVEKEVRNVTAAGEYGDKSNANIGDEVEYKMTVSLAENTQIPLALLNFSDAIDENLDIDISSLKVEKRGRTYEIGDGKTDIKLGSEQGEKDYYENIMRARIGDFDPEEEEDPIFHDPGVAALDPEPTIYYYIQDGVLHIYGLGTMGKYVDNPKNAGVADYVYDEHGGIIDLSKEDVVITVNAEVTGANNEGKIFNQAAVNSGSLSNSILSNKVEIAVNPSLTLKKYVDKEEANEGSTLEYIVHISNLGGDWYGDITDPLSDLITRDGDNWAEVYKRISWESEGSGNGQNPGEDEWEIVDEEWELDNSLTLQFAVNNRIRTTIATGEEYYIKFKVTVNDDAYTQTVLNRAYYEDLSVGTNYDGSSNEVSTLITGVAGELDVEKSVYDSGNNKLDDGAYVDVDDILTYSIAVKNVNTRPSTVVNLKIEDIIPEGLTYIANSLTYDNDKYTGRFYEENGKNIIEIKANDGTVLQRNEEVTVTYKVRVTGYGDLTNIVTATSDDDDDDDTSTVVSAHTVTYDANEGSGPEDMLIYEDKGIKHEGEYTIKDVGSETGEIPFTRSGYEFLGWSTNKDAGEADDDYEPGTVISSVEQNVYLYAIWKKSTAPQIEIKKTADSVIEVTTEETVEIAYTIEVENTGEEKFEGYIEDILPADLENPAKEIRVSITDENNTTTSSNYDPVDGVLKINLNLEEGKKAKIEFKLIIKVADLLPQEVRNVAIARDKDDNKLDDSTVTTDITEKDAEPDPGIKLIKAVSKSVVKEGGELTYVLTLDNPSNDVTWRGRIEDLLPAGVQLVSDTDSIYNIIASSDSVKYDTPSSAPSGVRTEISVGNIELPPQQWISISVNVEVTASKGTRLENYGEGKGSGSSDDLTSNKVYTYVSDNDVIIDLAYIVKNADPTSITASNGTVDGETIKYTIDVINPNPTSWSGYVVDSLPPGMTAPTAYMLYKDGSSTGTSHDMVNNNGTFRFSIDDLESNHYVTIEFTVTLTNSVPDRAVNVAQLFASTGTEVDRDSALTVISGRGTGGGTPKIEITKTADKNTAAVDDTLTYTIEGTNTSDDIWRGTITDTLPENVKLITDTISITFSAEGSYDTTDYGNGLIEVTGIDLDPQEKITINFDVEVLSGAAGKTITNEAAAVSTNNGEGDSASVDTRITSGGSHDTPEIKLTKIRDKEIAAVGQNIVYSITAENTSQVTWEGSIRDLIPAGTSYVLGSAKIIPEGGSEALDDSGGAVTVRNISLAPNEEIVIVFSVNVRSSAAGTTVTNTANAVSTNGGNSPSASVDTYVTSGGPDPTTDVHVIKSAPQYVVADITDNSVDIDYTINVINRGDDDWSGTLTDYLPDNAVIKNDEIKLNGTVTPYNSTSDGFTMSLDVEAGKYVKIEFTITLDISASRPTSVTNSVLIRSDDGYEDEHEVTTDIRTDEPTDKDGIDLKKDVKPTTAEVGGVLTYTILATITDADWIGEVRDAVPAGTEIIESSIVAEILQTGAVVNSGFDNAENEVVITVDSPLTVGDIIVITFQVTVQDEAADTTVYNMAYAAPDDSLSGYKDKVESNEVDTYVKPKDTPNPGTPNISVEKTGPGEIGKTAKEIPYQLLIENNGDGDWTGKIVDTFASGLTVKSVTDENGGLIDHVSSGNVITIANFTVPADTKLKVNIILEIPDGFTASHSQIVNKVQLIPDGKDDPDDEDETTTTITENGPEKVKLSLQKRSSPRSGVNVNTGNQITYTIRVTNMDHDNQEDWVGIITDEIPAGTTFVANSIAIGEGSGLNIVGEYNSSSNSIVVRGAGPETNFTLKYNESFTITFKVTVNSGTEGSTIRNIANGTSDNGNDDAKSNPVTNTVNKDTGGGGGGGGGGTGGGDRDPSVIYHANNGSGERNVSETHRQGTTVTVKGISIFTTPEGYTFEGWAESASGNVVYDPGDTFTMPSSNVNLYAVWTSLLNYDDHYAYIVGYDDGLVKPNNNVSREEVASIFFRLLTDEARNSYRRTSNRFPDVEADRWSTISISTLTNMGILTGYEDGTFDPGGPITRAELAVVAANFDTSEYTGGTTRFNDLTDHWATNFIGRASARGWVSGYPDGSFKPDNYITRAELVTLVNNVLHRHPRNANSLLSNMTTFPDNSDTTEWYYLAIQEASNSHYYDYDSDSDTEVWTELRTNRDWAQIERL